MTCTEDQFRSILRAEAADITAGSIPPLALADQLLGPAGRLSRWPAGAGPGFSRRLLIPLAAAAAVVVVVATSIAVRGVSQARPQPHQPAAALKQVPTYYMFVPSPVCDRVGRSCTATELTADVVSTQTGRTVATVRPPRSSYFLTMAGASNDRVFVLFATPLHWTPPKSCAHAPPGTAYCLPPLKPYLARVNPADGAVRLSVLPIPAYRSLDGPPALSPDGTELAYGTGGYAAAPEAQIRVYSLTSGTVKVWQDKGSISSIGWGTDGQLGIGWDGAHGVSGIEVLNTNTAGGSLLSASRLAVNGDQPDHYSLPGGWVMSANGTTVIAPVLRTPWRSRPLGRQIRWYSVATGREIRAYTPPAALASEEWQVLWSNSSGTVVVVRRTASDKADRSDTFGVLTGNGFVPLPVARPAGQAIFFFGDLVGF